MTLFQEMFGKRKAVIAMAHFPPLPGQPLHDRSAGVRGVVDAVRRDLEHLADSGVDAVMFCNEGDRPYRTVAGPETTAVMGAAVAELSRDLPIPFGVDVLWDPKAALALAHATGALFVREVFTGAYAGDFGVWNTDPAETLSFRDRIGADGVKMFYNVTAEFAAPIAPRDIALTARSAVFSSLADAVCVSGVVTGTGVDVAQLRAAKEAVGEVPVIANTGVNPQTVGQMLAIADACIVGTALKRDGVTWNEVDPERVKRLVSAAAESGHWEPARRGGA
ncbi:BtpA/SgcQ family protein [Spongiactinospora sp. 9N601]|uniref:BtpA/SgcQ family protein n=1 Tax=Spongiactinospora sp. 9N601 TaxID=3375149 RepID=UPI0037B78B19